MANESLDRHRRANQRLTTLVKADLERFFRVLDLRDPEGSRDALLDYLPILVESYGEIAAQLALEWYDELRFASGAAGAFTPILPPPLDLAVAVQSNVRYAAGHLFRGEPEKTLSDLSIAVQKHVRAPGRQVISWNSELEGVRWARVPQGTYTCSFCLVLASRGAVYISDRSAGSKDYGAENEFHGECDCEIMRFGPFDEYPEGYLQKELLDMYRVSSDAVGSTNDINLIVYDVRRRFSDSVKDGVTDDDYLSDPQSKLPEVRRMLAANRRK